MLVVCLAFLASFQAVLGAFHVGHRADCQKKTLCNGNLMCAEVCERGTVKIDHWIQNSLTFQRQLQRNDKLVYFEMPSSHNSGIAEAEGFGIEKYFVSALYGGTNLDQGDDLHEGVCQYLSLTDQLNMGIRHLEIDVWWGIREQDILVCHSSTPNQDTVENITATAKERGIPLEWDPRNLSCLGTRRYLTDVLTEIKDWMMLPENLEEIVMIYYDTKFYFTPEQVTKAHGIMASVFGSMIYKASEGNPLLKYSPQDFLARGQRVMFENLKECWTHSRDGEQFVFYPALWTHQFDASKFTEFPDCAVEGDRDWYGKQWVRALDGSFLEAATRCGVQVVSGNYVNPDDIRFNVWSWDYAEPSSPTGCVALLPSSRWATVDCSLALPFACVGDSSAESGAYSDWHVDLNVKGSREKASCPSGYRFAAPHNGYSNNLLNLAALGQMIWLNVPNPQAN